MEFMKKMEDKIFDKFDNELNAKKNLEQTDTYDNNTVERLNEEIQKIINNEKKNREETQEGILEMITIMNDKMKNDLNNERKEREQNEEILIDVLENT